MLKGQIIVQRYTFALHLLRIGDNAPIIRGTRIYTCLQGVCCEPHDVVAMDVGFVLTLVFVLGPVANFRRLYDRRGARVVYSLYVHGCFGGIWDAATGRHCCGCRRGCGGKIRGVVGS